LANQNFLIFQKLDMSNAKSAISPTRAEDYPEWYQQVIKGADLAETSAVRGCMVIKPWGYSPTARGDCVLPGPLKNR
jgi:prolyl-tRNA synthetase